MTSNTNAAQRVQSGFIDPIRPALTVGAVTGTAGLLFGATAGVLRSTTPLLFSIAAGTQCFSLGTSFWYFRGALLQASTNATPSPREKTKCSTLAGTLAGAANGALRSRANVIPGAIVFTCLGFIGQVASNKFEGWRLRTYEERQRPLLQRITQSKWIPMKTISDEDYVQMLEERSMSLDTEIALIDEKIEAFKSVLRE